jgi:hypothetical protein
MKTRRVIVIDGGIIFALSSYLKFYAKRIECQRELKEHSFNRVQFSGLKIGNEWDII